MARVLSNNAKPKDMPSRYFSRKFKPGIVPPQFRLVHPKNPYKMMTEIKETTSVKLTFLNLKYFFSAKKTKTSTQLRSQQKLINVVIIILVFLSVFHKLVTG